MMNKKSALLHHLVEQKRLLTLEDIKSYLYEVGYLKESPPLQEKFISEIDLLMQSQGLKRRIPSEAEIQILEDIQGVSVTEVKTEYETDSSEQVTKISSLRDGVHEPTLIGSVQKMKSSPILVPQVEQKEQKTQQRYELLNTLGEGGMGIVQLVLDRQLKREVALKKLKLPKKQEGKMSKMQEAMLWRLKREASITAILEHPNIVPLYDMEEIEAGNLYFTMRKVEGETLSAILKKKHSEENHYSQEQILAIFFKVCDAVRYAHSKKIVHRDLKPPNIMVGAFGEVYVMDWGIAKILGEAEAEEMSVALETEDSEEMKTVGGMGTPGYMSPEQQEDASQVGVQTDIFALGIILRECFTGVSPVQEFKKQLEFIRKQNKAAKFNKTLKENSVQDQLPADLRAIIAKATNPKIKERYKTVRALTEDLERYLKNVGVSAREYNFFELFGKWIKRNKKRMALFFSVFFLLTALFFYLHYKEEKTRNGNFLRFYQQAEQQIQNAQSVDEGKSIELLLSALSHINVALTIKPHESLAEEKKANIGVKLVSLSSKTQNYKIAYYVLRELESLNETILPLKQRKELTLTIEEEEKKLLEKQYTRFQYWIKKFQKELPSRENLSNALLEINEMKTIPKVLDEIQKYFSESVHYFVDSRTKTHLENEFYLFIVEAMGCCRHPKTIENTVWALQNLVEKTLDQKKKMTKKQQEYFKLLCLNFRYYELNHYPEFLKPLHEMYKKIEDDSILKGFFLDQQKLALLPNDKNTKSDLTYSVEGDQALHHKEYKRALEIFERWVEAEPQNSSAYLGRARAKEFCQDISGAFADYDRAIFLRPENDVPYLNRAHLNEKQKKWKEALNDFTASLQRNPHYIVYIHRGNLRRALGDIQGAIEDYTASIQLYPDYPWSYNQRGICKFFLTRYEEAIEDYSKAILLNPKYIDALRNRAHAYIQMKRSYEALTDYENAIDAGCRDQQAFISCADIRFQLEDFETAFLDVNYAILINPKEVAWPLYLKWAEPFFKKGMLSESIQIIQYGVEAHDQPILKENYLHLLHERIKQSYLQKRFESAQEDILLFKKYATPSHVLWKHVLDFESQIKKVLR